MTGQSNMTRDVKYGLGGVPFPPFELNEAAVRGYEAAGLDFVAYWDNTCMTFPRSIWTEDLIPAAGHYDCDMLVDGFSPMMQAAMVSEKLEIMLMAVDVFRREPPILAQQILAIDHLSRGRAIICVGAGETKQFSPYGIPREKPFTRMEEALEIVRLLIERNDLIDYDGKIWKLRNAIMSCPPYEGRCPPLLVTGGPGKALDFAGRLGDGWAVFLPPCGTAEWYAERVQEIKRTAERHDKDPEKLIFAAAFMTLIDDDEAAVERAVNSPALRWDAAATLPSTLPWTEAGFINPLGEDWAYSRDLIPMNWGREDALKVIEQVTPEMVRALRVCGTPEQAAMQIQPYIEAGCNYVWAANYLGVVARGNWGGAESGGSQALFDTYSVLRQLNHQPEPALV
jgi:phthiodiolone/phenolphthiodiolone dimycocerosates ketoreductase